MFQELSSHLQTMISLVAEDMRQMVWQGPKFLQFFIRDMNANLFVMIDEGTRGTEYPLVIGKHQSPDMTIYLTERDISDFVNFGCVRNVITLTGNRELILLFRNRFMMASDIVKRRIESRVAIMPRRNAIDEISVGSLSATTFINKYASNSLPVLITGAMPNCRKIGWTREKVQQRLGSVSVTVRTGQYASNIYSNLMETEIITLHQYLEPFVKDSSPAEAMTIPPYAASNLVPPEWTGWLDYPPFVQKELCALVKFWIGPKGTVTPLHRDWFDNFLTQIIGSKQLLLFSPDHARLFSPKTIHKGLDSCSWLDPYDQSNSIIHASHALPVTLHAGEMLFLPAGWFHDVRATGFSFSANFFVTRVPYAVCP